MTTWSDFGEAVGGILVMDGSDWSNAIRHHTCDTRFDTEFKHEPVCPRPHANDPCKVLNLTWKGVDDCEALLAGRD
jgi:hypothetical protein